MGRPGAFMEIDRREPGERAVEERVRDFRAVELLPDPEETRRQASRCMECGTPFCHAAGCPLGNQVPELNDLVWRGRWRDALELLLSTNPFPEITSQVCPALCEGSCALGIEREPVTIRQVERAIVEEGRKRGWIVPRPPRKRRAGAVAVVGAGPAGLAAADTLNKIGYNLTVFDEAARPGGILRYGIPEFKLEKAVLDRRVALMREEGVRFEAGVRAGEDVSWRFLRDRFVAVCLACGAREPRDLHVPGRELGGVHFALEYLAGQNRRLAGEPVGSGEAIGAAGKRVVIVGGGDTGADCLGTALRQGARSVVQLEILPEPPPERAPSTPWPEWPLKLRSSSSHREGGERRWGVTAKALAGEAGRVTALLGCRVRWEAPADGGRPVPRELEGSDFELPAELVLIAMGFRGAEGGRIVEELGLATGPGGAIERDGRGMSAVPGVFVAGDAARGASLVARAVADGMRVARAMAAWIEGIGRG